MNKTVRTQGGCPRCGAATGCGMEAGVEPCWCAVYPPVFAVPSPEAGKGCYCPACLTALVAERQAEAGEKAAEQRRE